MKKSFISVCAALICTFSAGCGTANAPDYGTNSDSSAPSQTTTDTTTDTDTGTDTGTDTPAKLETPYTEADLATLAFTDTQKGLTVDVSANTYLKSLLLSTEYLAYTPQTAPQTAKYIISMQSMDLQVYANGVVGFVAEKQPLYATVNNGDFSYFDELIAGEVTHIDGYTTSQKISLYDADNGSGKIEDRQAFLQTLQTIGLVKLGNKAHYEIGKRTYLIKIDKEYFRIYQNFVVFGNELYAIYEGDFEFLTEISYTPVEDGWLPEL